METRRSTPAIGLGEPGPSPEQIERLLQIAARAPDHGKLAPWRFLVFTGEARATAGAVLAKAWASKPGGADDEQRVKLEADRFMRAPVVIAVISAAIENHKIPLWEQYLSAGAVCQNLLIAGHAMGFAGQWLTEWYAYDASVLTGFGLGPHERVAGYLYFGTAKADAVERPRPDIAALTTHWSD